MSEDTTVTAEHLRIRLRRDHRQHRFSTLAGRIRAQFDSNRRATLDDADAALDELEQAAREYLKTATVLRERWDESALQAVSAEARVAELEAALREIAGDGKSYARCLPECKEGPPTCGCAEDRARAALGEQP